MHTHSRQQDRIFTSAQLRRHFANVPGFTLIEMLVVIAIIGVLAALGLISFTGTQKQTRDARRKSDLRFYQTSLAEFATKNGGYYPSRTTVVHASTTLCSDLTLTNCPEDPKATSPNGGYYKYLSDGTGSAAATAKKYVIWGPLENTTGDWVVCSTGTPVKVEAEPTTFDCPSGGGVGTGVGI